MRQKLERKRQHQWIFWVSLLMETRLMEKVGTQRTLSNVNVELSLPVPIWVTCTMSPLGNLTEICTKKVIEERRWTKWTI